MRVTKAEPIPERMFAEMRRLIADIVTVRPFTIWLHGSYATGRARVASDIDLAIDAVAALAPTDIALVAESLEESTLPYHFDVCDLARTSQAFADRVRAIGTPWRIEA